MEGLSFTDLIALVLAAGGILHAWFQGDLFASKRSLVEARQDASEPDSWSELFWDLWLCDLCLGYHVAFWLVLGSTLAILAGGTCAVAGRIIVYAFAVARGEWIINQLLPNGLRHQPQFLITGDPDEPDTPARSDPS